MLKGENVAVRLTLALLSLATGSMSIGIFGLRGVVARNC
jgi:hypothetical protein